MTSAPAPIASAIRSDSPAPAWPALARSRRRQLIQAVAAGLMGYAAWPAARAQSGYPSKPIRMVVPFTPGGSTDILARAIALKLGEAWRQAVVIENVPGAGGSIGADRVAKAAPDGYTLLMGHIGTLAVTPSLYPKLPYDPIRGFTAIAWVARVPNVLVIHPSVPARTVAQLVAYAKKNPGTINYGSGGNGSAAHIATEYFKLQTGTQLQHVPYKGTAPAVTDLLAGQIQLLFTGVPAVINQVRAGQLRAIAVSSPRRIPILQDVPTVAESGYRGFEADQWYGIVGPAGMAPELVATLNGEINKVLQSPAIVEQLSQEGAEPTPRAPEVFQKLIVSEIARWRDVIRKGDVRLQ